MIPHELDFLRPVLKWLPGKGRASRLVLPDTMDAQSFHSMWAYDPFTGRRTELGKHRAEMGEMALGCDPSGSLIAAIQVPNQGDYGHHRWHIKSVKTRRVLVTYEHAYYPDVIYPTWFQPAEDVLCCSIRKTDDGDDVQELFVRFRRQQPSEKLQDSKSTASGKQHALPGQVQSGRAGTLQEPEWIKEFSSELPVAFSMDSLCPDGRIVISVAGIFIDLAFDHYLVHLDTATALQHTVMRASEDYRGGPMCFKFVPAGPRDPMRFCYVAAGANNHICMVDARAHNVLYAWSASGLLQGSVPRAPKPVKWKEMDDTQLRSLPASKRVNHVKFLLSTSGLLAFSAAGGTMSITYF